MTLETFEASLPAPPNPVGSYLPCVQSGNLVFTSGVLPLNNGVVAFTGQVGSYALPLEKGQEAARLCIINALSVLKAHLGSLSRVQRVVKLTGFVNSASSFYQQPVVINPASDLLFEVFGEAGRHARSAVGVASLPLDAAVELELIVEVTP
jgi:enamine deaminase RidA (YjgF/YER057c/UK114 family)